MKDYTGKTVFVGIDVHKKKYVIFCICEQERVKNWSMSACPHKLAEQLKRYFAGADIKTVYEAGFSGYVLHRKLIEEGIDSIVINPGSIETASRDRVKTDKRDAKKLSEQLSAGRLECIYIPTKEEELARLLSRLRKTLVGDRSRIACRIKAKLNQFGYLAPYDKKQTNITWIKKLKENLEQYPEELAYILEYNCDKWLQLTEDIKGADKKLAEHSEKHPAFGMLEEVYKSFPGLGIISAGELSRELGDLSQFGNINGAYSYTGLTPGESSSGEKRRQGSISHCGRPRIRHLLVEIAWRAIRKDAELRERFERLTKRGGKKRAIVAIARLLIGRLRFCLRNGVFYEMQPLNSNKEKLAV